MSEKLSPAQLRAINWIQGHNAVELGALGTEVGKMLAELIAELADAKAECAHWKAAFETVRDEIKVLAAVAIQQRGEKLIVTRKELQALEGKELHVGEPEPGVRIYEVRERRSTPAEAVSQILKPH